MDLIRPIRTFQVKNSPSILAVNFLFTKIPPLQPPRQLETLDDLLAQAERFH
jgi:hypothetical protein